MIVDSEEIAEFSKKIEAVVGEKVPYMIIHGVSENTLRIVSNMDSEERGVAIGMALEKDPEAYRAYIAIMMQKAMSTPEGRAAVREFMGRSHNDAN